MNVDWSGLGMLVGAIGGFLTVLVNLFITIMNWRDQREAREEAMRHKEILCSIADQVGANTNAGSNPKVS